MKKILKKLGLISIVSSTIVMNGCTPQEATLVSGMAVGTVLATSILSSAPRNNAPYYYQNNRYYTGGYYRNGYYYHNGRRYSNGRYYRGRNRYDNGRRYNNRRSVRTNRDRRVYDNRRW